jgi:glucose-1-phosphate thymidylyltransferase
LKCGVVTVDENDRILRMTEKSPTPETHWCTPPFYFYTEEDLGKIQSAIEEGCGVDAPGSLVAWMCAHSRMYSMEMPGRRFDIGNLESYETARNNYRGITK